LVSIKLVQASCFTLLVSVGISWLSI